MAAQRKQVKQWQPFTKLVWLVFIVGIAVQYPAGRVILGIVAGAVLLGLAAAVIGAGSRRQPSRKSAEDETLDQIIASWGEE